PVGSAKAHSPTMISQPAPYVGWKLADPRLIPQLSSSAGVRFACAKPMTRALCDFRVIRPPWLRFPLLPDIPACRHGGEWTRSCRPGARREPGRNRTLALPPALLSESRSRECSTAADTTSPA